MMSISDSEEFNIKCFIEEVRKRPELWDSSHEDYKNREQRQNAWLDICSVFIQDFGEKETEEQLIGGRELQQKWKYIRDAYTRQVRLAALRGLGEGSNKYIYGKYLRFLNVSNMENKRRNWSPPSTSEVGASNNVKTLSKKWRLLRPAYSGIIRSKRYKYPSAKAAASESYEASITSPIYESVPKDPLDCSDRQSENDMNDDAAFFKSLLPTLSELTSSQKLLFRIDVMKILHSYATQSHVYITENRITSEADISKVYHNETDTLK